MQEALDQGSLSEKVIAVLTFEPETKDPTAKEAPNLSPRK